MAFSNVRFAPKAAKTLGHFKPVSGFGNPIKEI